MGLDKNKKSNLEDELRITQRTLSLLEQSKFSDPYHVDKLKRKIKKLQQSLAA